MILSLLSLNGKMKADLIVCILFQHGRKREKETTQKYPLHLLSSLPSPVLCLILS